MEKNIVEIPIMYELKQEYKNWDKGSEKWLKGKFGEELAELIFKSNGWKILKKGVDDPANPKDNDPYDLVVSDGTDKLGVNVKFGNVFWVYPKNIARIKETGFKPALLLIDENPPGGHVYKSYLFILRAI